jgi:hypothetical protein
MVLGHLQLLFYQHLLAGVKGQAQPSVLENLGDTECSGHVSPL